MITRRRSELGDEQGIRAAYSAHAGELYGFALRSLGDGGLAEEAVQETFTRAWRAAGRFDPQLGSAADPGRVVVGEGFPARAPADLANRVIATIGDRRTG